MPGVKKPQVIRKRFGQHFLRDPEALRQIIDQISPARQDRLIEIGPGRGALTWMLLSRVATLDAIEIDRDLAASLALDPRGHSRLRLHVQDALQFDFTAFAASGAPLRIVGNLPYNISTPLLFHLLEHRAVIADVHCMLQKEVVDRMVALPGSRDYGRLTVMLRASMHATRLFDVPAQSFKPVPKVDSSFVRLDPNPHSARVAPIPELQRVVAAAFSQRRKTLRNALRALLDVEHIAACGIDPGARPETLTMEEFERLAQAVRSTPHATPA